MVGAAFSAILSLCVCVWRWLFRRPLLFPWSLFLSLQLSTCLKRYCFLDKVLHTMPLTFSLSQLSQETRSQCVSQAIWGSTHLWECWGCRRAVECRAGCLYLEASICNTVWPSSMWTMRCKGLGSTIPGHSYFLDIPCQFRRSYLSSCLETPIGMLTGVAQNILVVEELESFCCEVLFAFSRKKKCIAHGSISTLIVKDIVSSVSKHPDE